MLQLNKRLHAQQKEKRQTARRFTFAAVPAVATAAAIAAAIAVTAAAIAVTAAAPHGDAALPAPAAAAPVAAVPAEGGRAAAATAAATPAAAAAAIRVLLQLLQLLLLLLDNLCRHPLLSVAARAKRSIQKPSAVPEGRLKTPLHRIPWELRLAAKISSQLPLHAAGGPLGPPLRPPEQQYCCGSIAISAGDKERRHMNSICMQKRRNLGSDPSLGAPRPPSPHNCKVLPSLEIIASYLSVFEYSVNITEDINAEKRNNQRRRWGPQRVRGPQGPPKPTAAVFLLFSSTLC